MKKIIILILLFCVNICMAQQSIQELEQEFNKLAEVQPGLNEAMDSEVSGLNLSSFISSVAYEHKINAEVDPALNNVVEANYFNHPVKDVLLYLIQRYDIDVKIINNVISFKKKEPVVIPPKKPEPKLIDVVYRNENDFLSVNLKNDSLPKVAEKITKESGKNVVVSPNVKGTKVSGYFQNRPFEEILNMVGQANGLVITKNENGSYFIEKDEEPKSNASNTNGNRRGNRRKPSSRQGEKGFYEVSLSETGFLNINTYEATVSDVILDAAEKLKLNYYLYSIPDDINTTVVMNGVTFDDLLKTVFRGKDYTYATDQTGLYFIGKRKEEGLRSTELIQLENRTIETILASIPGELKKDLEVKEFPELNGLIVSGSKPKIEELRNFIYQIDKVVPMVQLEVFIVQYNKSHDVQTGMQAGLDNTRRTTSGVLFPTTDVSMNAESVNSLIDMFNGFGIFNLGKVTEQFYLNLKFLENNSIVKMESTPKTATLSGHEAVLKIGEESWYFEQQNSFIPLGNNNQVTQSGTWKSTNADLSVTMKPIVSKDEQITIELTVEKSAFLGRAGENAPPGKATQSFNSFIRVKNNEMVFLGGLDELENENSGTGVPVISRIPILKWFFSGRAKKKSKSKLNLFVKPTVSY